MLILKFITFYGGILMAVIASIFLWLFWRPELKAQAFCDESTRTIRCVFRVVRTFSPVRVTSIWIPVEYMETLEASPPTGFSEKLNRLTPVWLYDNAEREVVIWSGRLEVARGQTAELSIPARRPKAVSGTLRLMYEYRGVAGVLISSGAVDVPINKDGGC